MEASHATGLAEHMSIELPGGIATVKAPDDMEDMDTYLLFVTGDVLSGWYKKYGSKLMEANVRSFLSMRGKVNKGIRTTICNQPDRFVAYNNGLTATATHVKQTDRDGSSGLMTSRLSMEGKPPHPSSTQGKGQNRSEQGHRPCQTRRRS